MTTVDDKRNQIIDVALRRFSHFGIAKTSMSEIADDLKLSKANLYYYFPDKFSLIEAIAYRIVDESDTAIYAVMETTPGTLEVLHRILDLRQEALDKYYMLFLNLQEMNINEERWVNLSKQLFQREVDIISRIFERGINRNELVTFSVQETSELYVAIIRGLTMFCGQCMPTALPDREEINRIVAKQKQVASIFINGIKK